MKNLNAHITVAKILELVFCVPGGRYIEFTMVYPVWNKYLKCKIMFKQDCVPIWT